jgi:hypothetical protein
MFDGQGKLRSKGAFEDASGVKFTGEYLNHDQFNYCAFPGFYEADNAHKWLPAPLWSVKVDVTDKAEVFGKYNVPLRGCYENQPPAPTEPYATQTVYGKGRIVYIAGSAFEHYYEFTNADWRAFFGKLIHSFAGNEFVLHNASTGVCMSVRESSENCTLVHLTNYTSQTRPITESAKLYDLVLEVPGKYSQAVDLWSNKQLQLLEPGKFAIDELSEIAVIKLS